MTARKKPAPLMIDVLGRDEVRAVFADIQGPESYTLGPVGALWCALRKLGMADDNATCQAIHAEILPTYRRIIRNEMLMAQMERAGLIVRRERKPRRSAKAGKGARR